MHEHSRRYNELIYFCACEKELKLTGLFLNYSRCPYDQITNQKPLQVVATCKMSFRKTNKTDGYQYESNSLQYRRWKVIYAESNYQ